MADLSALEGANRDAAAALTALFKSYGLETLAPQIVRFVQQGMGADAVAVELANTKEYKARFAANAAREKAGLPVLSPSEYLATERAYRQVMSAAGLPTGFYDQQSDFQKFLETDMSPTELKARVDTATEAINKAPAETLTYMKQWYGIGDLVAFALDPERATNVVEQRLKAAESAAYASSAGIGLSQQLAEQVGNQGFSGQQLQQGFGEAAGAARQADKLGQIYGGAVTAEDVVKDVFLGDAAAKEKTRRLASQERASFGGSNGTGSAAFGSGTGI